MIYCNCDSCEHYDDGACTKDDITISDDQMTGAGFVPLCTDYVEINPRDYEGETEQK